MQLYPYQQAGVDFCISRKGRALIADEMGLGKTPTALKVAEHYNQWPIVVVCPASLRLNWQRETLNWLPFFKPCQVQVFFKTSTPIDPLARVLILSYEGATARAFDLAMLQPTLVILDESHYVKNKDSQRTLQLVPLCRRAPRCLLLSGTPLLNRPIELWCQLEALNFSLGSYWEYAKKYCAAHQKTVARGRIIWDVSGNSNTDDLYRRLSSSVLIRRLKSDVLKDLPEKTRSKLLVSGVGRSTSFSQIQTLCGKALKKTKNDPAKALSLLREQKLITSDCFFSAYTELSHMKSKACSELAVELSCGTPLVVFGHHQNLLHPVHTALLQAGRRSALMDGSTPLAVRQKNVDLFQSGQLDVLVLSITAFCSGVTLTAASNILMCELPLSPGVALQAEDRIHRIGQKNAALIRYVVAEGTLDDSLWRIVSNKSRVSNTVLDGVSSSEFTNLESSNVGSYWSIVEETLLSIVSQNVIN